MCVCARTHACVHVQTHTHTCMHAHTQGAGLTHAQTHTHACMHAHTQAWSQSWKANQKRPEAESFGGGS